MTPEKALFVVIAAWVLGGLVALMVTRRYRWRTIFAFAVAWTALCGVLLATWT